MLTIKTIIRISTLSLALVVSSNAFSQQSCDTHLEKERKLLQDKELELNLRERHLEHQFNARAGQLELEYKKKMALAQLEIDKRNIETDRVIRERLKALEQELKKREAEFNKQFSQK